MLHIQVGISTITFVVLSGSRPHSLGVNLLGDEVCCFLHISDTKVYQTAHDSNRTAGVSHSNGRLHPKGCPLVHSPMRADSRHAVGRSAECV